MMHKHDTEEVSLITALRESCCSNLKKIFQSNYNLLHSLPTLYCESENQCRVENKDRISHLLCTYSNRIRDAKGSVDCRISPLLKSNQKISENKDTIFNLLDVQSEKNLFNSSASLNVQNKSSPVTNVFASKSLEICGSNLHNISGDDNDSKILDVRSERNEYSQEVESLINGACVPIKPIAAAESSDRPFKCTVCELAFKRKLHLKRHFLVTHTGIKTYICKVCEKSFSRKDYLDKHAAGHVKHNLKLKLLKEGVVVRTKIHFKSQPP